MPNPIITKDAQALAPFPTTIAVVLCCSRYRERSGIWHARVADHATYERENSLLVLAFCKRVSVLRYFQSLSIVELAAETRLQTTLTSPVVQRPRALRIPTGNNQPAAHLQI